jgi:hypothetical protein
MPPNSEIEKLERRWRDNPKGTVFAPYAEVLRKNGDHALARDVLRQGLELHPDHIPGNIVLGRCCLDLGEDGPAEAAFAHVLDLDAENVIALKALADITERQGRLAEANSWLSRLISVDPSNDEARDQFTRVTTAREAAAAALASEIMTLPEAPSPGSTAPTVELQLTTRPVPALQGEPQDRTEAGVGEIDDVGDVAAFADEALDRFLDLPEEPAAPPVGRVLPEAEVSATPVMPVFSAEPEPIAGLEPATLDLSAAAGESAAVEGLAVDEEFVPPAPEPPPRPSGPFTFGVVETAAEIEIRPAGVSEFQAPDDSTSLLDLTPGKSEFQVPDASADLQLSAGGKSEFQTPDASEELKFAKGSTEYQSPSGADELLESARAPHAAAPEPETREPEAPWSGPMVSSTLAAMAAMPTQELSTEPPAEPPVEPPTRAAPSWLFEDEEPEIPAPASDLPLITPEPEAEPEPVAEAAGTPEATAEPEPEAELATLEAETRSSAELRLIFPDDAVQPEPHRVRRITQAEITPPEEAPEPAIGEPEPIMTETMAELYARQGHTADAIRVYRALSEKQPGDARLRERIRELEAGSASAPRRHTYVAVDTGGESVESFFRSLAEARPGSGGAVPGFDQVGAAEDNSGAPTRPARDPLSLSAIFGEEPAQAPPPPKADGPPPSKPAPGPDAFSFDQFFGGPGSTGQSSTPARPSGASEEDLDQFQNWLKSLKR